MAQRVAPDENLFPLAGASTVTGRPFPHGDRPARWTAASTVRGGPYDRRMPSYVGPARLVVDGTVHDVAVNLHSFLDLSESPADRWRGVVVDAGFVPPTDTEPRSRRAELHLPDGQAVVGLLEERRLEGDGEFRFP